MTTETTTSDLTPRQRFDRASRALRKEGVAFFRNVKSCCRSCVDLTPKLKSPDQPVGWTFGGQGMAVRWNENGEPYRTSGEVSVVYVYHDNDSAPFLVEAFRKEGFKVVWNGAERRAVEVHF